MSLEIKKRGNTWTFVVDVGKDPLTGKRKRKSKGGFKTKGECRIAASKIINELENGTYYESSDIKLNEFLKKYLNTIQPNLSLKTFKTYEYFSNSYITPYLGEMKIKNIKPLQIQDFYNEISKNISSTTVRHIHNFLHKALNIALRWQLIKDNPSDYIEKPKRAKTEMHVLNEQQINDLLYSLKNSSIYLVVVIASCTGMREAEICGLKWENVDIDNKIIYVKSQIQLNEKNILTDVKLKTSNSYRQIPLPDLIVSELILQRIKYKENKDYFKDKYFKGDYVICKSDGTPYNPAYISRNFNRITREYKHNVKKDDGTIEKLNLIDELNIPPIRFHDLRHTHATLLLKSKLSIKVVAERLGDTTSTVMNTYAHVLPDMQKEAAEKLNNIFSIS
ncbi:site-specific integrase [Clostridium sp. DSM 100503]|uniref:site-specific integrase n=1 Tax=Clostridium sp. DSM 100503 TaxID=2963282 RepID=UPI002149C199|nr:site-specific integrase [Clostridium sp. DSM 100503]MCR1952937.1 site-specific integrase [Clostridium sp. DSM 100503]